VLSWNARSINTFGALERLINLRKIHNLAMIAILEPFTNHSQLDFYRMQLLMNQGHCHPYNKIWLFWSTEANCNILESDQQQVTCEISHEGCIEKFLMTYVYGKCKDHLRRPLWDNMGYSGQPYTWC
ncbi:hypothetical protein EJD97_001994, partial [Solanum chilense]